MAHRIAQWTFILAALFAAPAAFAQSDMPPGAPPMQQGMQQSPQAAAIRAACGQDFRRLCAGVQPGGGRVVQCLMAHRAELSPACAADLGGARGGGGYAAAPPPARPMPPPGAPPPPPPGGPPPAGDRAAFQASCGPDARLFCAGVPRDGIVKCLASHRAELSGTCKMFLRDMRAARGGGQAASLNAPPPPMPPPGEAPPPPAGAMPPPPAGAMPPPAGDHAAFQASCGPDTRLFCTGVPRDGIVKCLAGHRTELSATCKMFLRDMRAARSNAQPAGAMPPPPPMPPPGEAPPPAARPMPPAPDNQ